LIPQVEPHSNISEQLVHSLQPKRTHYNHLGVEFLFKHHTQHS